MRDISIGLLLLFAIGAAGCIPTGLPEYFAGLSATGSGNSGDIADLGKSSILISGGSASSRIRQNQPQRPILIVIPEDIRAGVGAEVRGGSLGHQYLFGLIPFTSVFFQHGLNSMLVELTYEVLAQDGFTPYLVNEKDAAVVARLLSPYAILEPVVPRLSLNAYDVIFIRIMSVSGELELNVLRSEPGGEVREMRRVIEKISATKIRRYAHGPSLVYLVEENLRAGIQQLLRRAISPGIPRATAAAIRFAEKKNQTAATSATLVGMPVFLSTVSEDIGQLLSSSYGFAGLAAYGNPVIGRIIQRGLASGLDGTGLRVAESIAEHPRISEKKLSRTGGAILVSIVKKITADFTTGKQPERLDLVMQFQLFVGGTSSSRAVVEKSWDCKTEVVRAQGVDGDWVVGLERAAMELARDLRHTDKAAVGNGTCRLASTRRK